MPNQVLYADRSIECGADPICIGTIATFLPLFTMGVPLTLLLWIRQGFSETGKKKLRARCADDKEYDAELARYTTRFAFFTGKYEAYYCMRDCGSNSRVTEDGLRCVGLLTAQGGTRSSSCSGSCYSRPWEQRSAGATHPSRSC